MLAIYENIEHNLPIPKALEDFEDLLKRDLQKPVLLTPSSLEEQKLLSTCVNSNAVLNLYNRSQVPLSGQPNSNSRVHASGTANSSSSGSGSGIRGNNSGQNVRGNSSGGPKGAISTSTNPTGRGRGEANQNNCQKKVFLISSSYHLKRSNSWN
jgi:hypothetical protein